MPITVLAGPTADAELVTAGPLVAPALVTVAPTGSSSDAADPITDYTWDFAGWGVTSTGPNPDPVSETIGQAGTWPVRLTITTQSGLTDTIVLDVVVD